MKKKPYEAPRTTKSEVELEQGFMNASVYQTKENTEALNIEDQKVSEQRFDFTDSEWGNSGFNANN